MNETKHSITQILTFINPLVFYYALAFAIGKVIQIIVGGESIWQWSWNIVIDTLGDDQETYAVWVMNTWGFIVYWMFAAALMLMEAKVPQTLEPYRIQPKSDKMETPKPRLRKVR